MSVPYDSEPLIIPWCHENGLSTITDRLLQESLDDPVLLKALPKTDQETIAVQLKFTWAEKAKFFLAIENWVPPSENTTDEPPKETKDCDNTTDDHSKETKDSHLDLLDRMGCGESVS